MLIFSIFAISAGTYMVVYSVSEGSELGDAAFGSIAIGSAFALALIPLLAVIDQLNATSGLNNFMVDAWRALSGVSSGAHITGCDDVRGAVAHQNGLVMLNFIFIAVAMFLTFFAIVGPVVGAVWTLFGLLTLMGSDGKDLQRFKQGLKVMTYGFGAIFVSGLLFRLIHAITVASCT